jgi:hypothetical protein
MQQQTAKILFVVMSPIAAKGNTDTVAAVSIFA